MNRARIVAFVAGGLFALGLAISGMAQPSKVIGFLDVTSGRWDPSLMFVMGGAIAVAMPFFIFAQRRGRPLFTEGFRLPEQLGIDRNLLGGAVLFGVGWGLGGYCPGPALLSLTTLAPGVLVFVATMVVGFLLYDRVWDRASGRA